MAARTFKIIAKARVYRRNTTRSSSVATLFALAALAATLFTVSTEYRERFGQP